MSQKIFLNSNQKYKVLINTIPHCGTHLVSSILDTIGYSPATYRKFGIIKKKVDLNWRLSEKILNLSPEKYTDSIQVSVGSPKLVRFNIVKKTLNQVENGKYALSHVPFNEELSNYLISNNWKGIFIIRDPRDMISSMLRHIENRSHHPFHFYLFKKKKSNSERIEEIVKGFINEKNRKFVGINRMYTSMLKWKKSLNFVFLKYEELVGSKGDGDAVNQKNSIKKILNKLNFTKNTIDNNLLNYIGNESYGKSGTFRKGKIGSWKDKFNEKDVIIFKKYANELLISLGYEKE